MKHFLNLFMLGLILTISPLSAAEASDDSHDTNTNVTVYEKLPFLEIEQETPAPLPPAVKESFLERRKARMATRGAADLQKSHPHPRSTSYATPSAHSSPEQTTPPLDSCPIFNLGEWPHFKTWEDGIEDPLFKINPTESAIFAANNSKLRTKEEERQAKADFIEKRKEFYTILEQSKAEKEYQKHVNYMKKLGLKHEILTVEALLANPSCQNTALLLMRWLKLTKQLEQA